MKAKNILILLFLLLLFSSVTFSADEKKAGNEFSEEAIDNLLVGLNSENFGLKTSSAYMLGEAGDSRAVIPLMALLHDKDSEDARIVAALALYKIGDTKGLFAVKQAGRFDESERVRKLCNCFYNDHLQKELFKSFNVALAQF